MMELLRLCWEFFKTGLFAIGGGLATIPFLAQIATTHPEWFTMTELADMIAIAESTPGPIGVNMSTFAGFRVAGVAGGIFATLALVLPSFLIMLPISRALTRYRDNALVNASFQTLRPAVTGLIAAAAFTVLKLALLADGVLYLPALALFVLILLCTQWKKTSAVHPIVWIGAAALAGVLFQL